MMPDEHADPNDTLNWRREISERQGETEKVVHGLAISVSRMEQSISDLASAVKGLATDQRIDRKPFQWSVAISFATLVLGIAGAFTVLTLTPVRDQQLANTSQIAALTQSDMEAARWRGVMEGTMGEREKRIVALEAASLADLQRHFETLRSSSYQIGRQEAYEGRLDRLSGRIDKLHSVP